MRLPLLARLVSEQSPDIVCLQETKCQDDDFPHDDIAALGFQHRAIWGQKSYNGVAILSRHIIANVVRYARCGQDDCRHISGEVNGVQIHNVYIPAGGYEPDAEINPKFQHKLAFVDEMAAWGRKQKSAARLLVGDLNIAPLEQDVWDSKKMQKTVSHTPIEREKFLQMQIQGDWVDVMRAHIPPTEKLYTWWTYRQPDWEGVNKGRRLDHVLASKDQAAKIRSVKVLREARGWEQPSDHAPVLFETQ